MAKVFKHLSKYLATLFGVGFSPFFPGTLGTLIAVIFYWFIGENSSLFFWITICFLIIGFPSIASTEKQFGYKDPPPIILDEVIGYMICMLGIPYSLKICFSGVFYI